MQEMENQRERDGVEGGRGTTPPTVGGQRLANWTLPALELGQRTTFHSLLGLRELTVEGLHVQSQRPLVDVLLLAVGVLHHAPVVLQQTVV